MIKKSEFPIGFEMLTIATALDLVLFGFEMSHNDGTTSYFGLHTNCPWKLLNGSEIVVGSEDRDKIEIDGKLKYTFTHLFNNLINNSKSIIILDVEMNLDGSLFIALSHGYNLFIGVYNSKASETELWRLINKTTREHFVAYSGMTFLLT